MIPWARNLGWLCYPEPHLKFFMRLWTERRWGHSCMIVGRWGWKTGNTLTPSLSLCSYLELLFIVTGA